VRLAKCRAASIEHSIGHNWDEQRPSATQTKNVVSRRRPSDMPGPVFAKLKQLTDVDRFEAAPTARASAGVLHREGNKVC
jgi:hypothetical protein